MTTPDADKIAEVMARKCALGIVKYLSDYTDLMKFGTHVHADKVSRIIERKTALVQLINVAIAADTLVRQGRYFTGVSDTDRNKGTGNYLADELSELKEQMPELFE